SPAAGPGPIAVPLWPFVAGFAALGALLCAYTWATPRVGETLGWFLLDLLLGTLMVGAYLLQLARFRLLRSTLPVLPFWGVFVVRRVAGLVGGGWAGGWALGLAGAIIGGLAGAVAGWLFVRRVLSRVWPD